MILLGILMQRSQHCVLRADGLQGRGESQTAVQFLLLLLVPLRSLLEGLLSHSDSFGPRWGFLGNGAMV